MIDAVSLAPSTIDKRKIPLRTLSECTGYPISELWSYFQNKKPCPNDRALMIANAVRRLDVLAAAVYPFDVSWKTKNIKQLVNRFATGELRVVVTDGAETAEGNFVVGDLVE